MGVPDPDPHISTEESRGHAARSTLVVRHLVSVAAGKVPAREAAHNLKRAHLGRTTELLGVTIETVGEEQQGLVGHAAGCQL